MALLPGLFGPEPLRGLSSTRAPGQYLQRSWGADDGLPEGSVYDLLQSSDGYLWIATQQGPVRFDGVRFVKPAHRRKSLFLQEDRDGNLWSVDGEGRLSRHDGSPSNVRFPVFSNLPDTGPVTLSRGPDEALWIGTGSGLYRLENLDVPKLSPVEGFESASVTVFHFDNEQLWAGTESGLFQFREGRGERFGFSQDLPGERILALHGDGINLWVATDRGVVLLQSGHTVRYPTAGTEAIRALLEDRDGNLWAATDRGLLRWQEDANGRPLFPEELPMGPINALLEDREGNLWAGSDDGTLHQLRNGQVTPYTESEGLLDDSIRTVTQDSDGTLWIGTESGHLHRLREGKIEVAENAPDTAGSAILSVHRDPGGTVWVGTGGGGLWAITDDGMNHLTAQDGLGSDIVSVLLSDERGDLWVGTAGGGLHRFRRGTRTAYTQGSGLPSNHVRALLEDRQRRLWIGTEGGLTLLEGGQLRTFSSDHGLASDFVLSLLEDDDGQLWVGTDGGLSRRTTDGRFISFDSRDGLYNEVLYQLQDDGVGFLWACSNKGVFRLSKRELEAESPASPITSHLLDGTRGRECNGFSQPSSWRDRAGSLWLSTVRGLLRVDPTQLEPNPLPPPVALESFKIDQTSADLRFPVGPLRGAQTIEFEYTALSFVSPERIRFRHKLESYDRQWFVDSRRLATYTNLPPGKYRFRVEADNAEGAWNRTGFSFDFEILPRFHETPLFYFLAALAALIVTWLLYRFRLQQLVRRNRQLGERVARRTAEVQLQKEALSRANVRLSKINRQLRPANAELKNLNREKADFLAIAAHDLRAPLVNLKGFTGELQSSFQIVKAIASASGPLWDEEEHEALDRGLGEDIPEALQFIEASADRMNQLVEALLALSQLGRQRLVMSPIDMDQLVRQSLDNLRYTLDQKQVEVRLHPLEDVVADPGALKQILDNLLHNAVSYLHPERPGVLEISGHREDGEVVFSVRDNGTGIAKEQQHRVFKLLDRAGRKDVPGEGMGLAFVRSLVERHGGRIWFESEAGVGTIFSFSLPRRTPGDETGHHEI